LADIYGVLRFLLKLAMLLCLTAAALLLVNGIYAEPMRINNDSEKFRAIGEDDLFSVVNTGNSHTQLGIDYGVIDSDAKMFNFAMSAQSLYYDWKLLEKYEKNLMGGGHCAHPPIAFLFYRR
jgi:hypothetical protein